jgi:AraC-like DNA-binding protein
LKERDMARLKAAPPRGIIKLEKTAPLVLEHRRYEVDAPLDASLEHWWSVAWKVAPGTRHEQSSLPHPSIHVVWEEDEVSVVGVVTGRFTRVLEGEGRAFAAKFRPGAFRPLLGAPVSTLTDRVVPLREVLGPKRAKQYRDGLARARDDHQRVAHATRFFTGLLPPPAADASLLAELVAAATTDRAVTTVEALRARAGLHLRELQRWFKDAVGISPKWMIQRYRLHEALLALEGKQRTIAQLAAELGYADQAHFTRDFRALIGVAPSRYFGRPR